MHPAADPVHDIARAFTLNGAILDMRPFGRGLINDTYLVTTDAATQPHVILQRINRRAFPEPELIMANVHALLEHIRLRQQTDRRERDLRFPALCPARDGRNFALDASGALWRALTFIEHTRTFDRADSPGVAAEAGFALGRFHALVRDLDPRRLHDTRPDFHNTPRHLERFDRALAAAGPRPESEQLGFCLAFIAARRRYAGELEMAKLQGRLHSQVIHGDPKLDNFLFDATSIRAVSLIDLDTVKPGLIHHDIADCLRSCCNTAGESPREGQSVRFDLDICRAFLHSYFAAAGAGAAPPGHNELFAAIRLIPFELGVRFLTDYLEGSKYFKIDYPEHNLVRAATQLRLSAEIELSEQAIKDMIAGTIK